KAPDRATAWHAAQAPASRSSIVRPPPLSTSSRLAACQDVVPAAALRRPRVVVFAGSHGIATRTFEGVGLSAFAPESDAQQIAELKEGTGPSHSLARRAGASITVVDCAPSAPIDVEPA
ncbi:nicotinate-nucleotide--dimethylbenzimidazole phosphoribosyltransferase, partial [Bacteroides fragilis]|nr:nicotinate-nucleotide--dimethylbenzimidazole phosphoribosyltransferase [Bacteroides fragilis]